MDESRAICTGTPWLKIICLVTAKNYSALRKVTYNQSSHPNSCVFKILALGNQHVFMTVAAPWGSSDNYL